MVENEDKLLAVKNFCDAYLFVSLCGKSDGTVAKETLRNVMYYVHHPVISKYSNNATVHVKGV